MDGRERRRRDFGRRSGRIIKTEILLSETETKKLAKEFAATLSAGDVICLVGDLGAGKTTFVKGLASYFGIPEEIVLSPTFNYMNQYENIAHFDLYRLQTEEQFLSMGFDEYFGAPFIAIIEWPNILTRALPKRSHWITLKHHPEGREIAIEKRIQR